MMVLLKIWLGLGVRVRLRRRHPNCGVLLGKSLDFVVCCIREWPKHDEKDDQYSQEDCRTEQPTYQPSTRTR